MGLSRSKHRRGEGTKPKERASASAAPRPEERSVSAGRPDAGPAAGLSPEEGAAQPPRPACAAPEKLSAKVKLNKKRAVIPQVTLTTASDETLLSYSSTGSKEQRTIREQTEWGPYSRHRNPSTIDAYRPQTTE